MPHFQEYRRETKQQMAARARVTRDANLDRRVQSFVAAGGLQLPTREAAQMFGVTTRTIVRWRSLIRG